MLENDSNYCPLRVTKETIQFGNKVVVPQGEIPAEGVCSASKTGKEPCYYASQMNLCQKRNQVLGNYR